MNPTQRFDPMDNTTRAMNADALQRTTAMKPARALEVRLVPGREATMANGPAREQFMLELRAGADNSLPGVAASSARAPLNLCLVIDRSGSMEGPPLEYVKQACAYVVDMLSPNDVLSIVTFEEIVEVLMPPQRVTNRQAIKDGIARLVAGNTTNLFDGLSLSVQQLLQNVDSNRATRMIVLTDGDPTAGIKDFQSLVTHVGDIKSRGITCTFLGLGPDYNEELIAAMAKKAGGNYYYIAQPSLIAEIFRAELEKLMSLAARNLNLDLKLSRWVRLLGATGLSTIPSGQEFSIPLADVEQGATIQLVFDFEFMNHPLGWYRIANGRLVYETGSGNEVQELDFVIEFTSDAARYSVPTNPEVAQAAQIAAASRTVEQTIMGLRTGQMTVGVAAQELQKTQMLLLNEGRVQEAQEVTMALRALQSGDQGAAQKTLMGAVVHLDQGKKS